LPDGDTLVARFGLAWSTEAPDDVDIMLLGPRSEVIAPPGRKRRSAGVSFACGRQYRVVGAGAGVRTVILHDVEPSGRVTAYAPGQAERWYTDSARCEADGLRVREAHGRLAELGFALHGGC